MSWVNIKASESLLVELNAAFPARDKRSDGTVGNQEHADRSSDHNPDETGRTPYEDSDSINEVHARDIDSDLNRPGWTMFRVFEIIRIRCEAGQERRVQNMICDGKITSRSWGFTHWRPYGGEDPHDTHGHISFRYGSGTTTANPENITAPWGLLTEVQREIREREEERMAMSQKDFDALLLGAITGNKAIAGQLRAIGWQYDGRGIPEDMTTLSVLNSTRTAALKAADAGVTLAELSDELLTDPATLADPETHPLVRALRYVLSHPPADVPSAPVTTSVP